MARCRKRSLAFDPAYCLSVPDWRVMLSCSTNSSLDRGTSRSRGQPHGETLHFLGSLKSVPRHQCLGNRIHLLCPWEKGAITQVKQKEALYPYAPMLGYGNSSLTQRTAELSGQRRCLDPSSLVCEGPARPTGSQQSMISPAHHLLPGSHLPISWEASDV